MVTKKAGKGQIDIPATQVQLQRMDKKQFAWRFQGSQFQIFGSWYASEGAKSTLILYVQSEGRLFGAGIF